MKLWPVQMYCRDAIISKHTRHKDQKKGENKVDCHSFLDKGCLCLNDLLQMLCSCVVSGEGC